MGQHRQMDSNTKAETPHRFPLDSLLHKLAVLRHSSFSRLNADGDEGSGASTRSDSMSEERRKAHSMATTSNRFPEQAAAYELDPESIGRGSTSKVQRHCFALENGVASHCSGLNQFLAGAAGAQGVSQAHWRGSGSEAGGPGKARRKAGVGHNVLRACPSPTVVKSPPLVGTTRHCMLPT